MENSYDIKTDNSGCFLQFEVPKAVGAALNEGKLILGSTIGKKGIEVWVQFMNPNLIHQTYTLEDAEEKLKSYSNADSSSSHEAGTSTSKVVSRPAPRSKDESHGVSVENFDPNREIFISQHEAREICESRKLNKHRIKGVLNEHAHDSLVRADFNRSSIHDFVARSTWVASNIGEAKAVSRINSNNAMRIAGVTSLKEWWLEATPDMRAWLLTRSRKIDIEEVDTSRLNKVGCPFRDAGLSASLNSDSDSD
jgi:hypothetical protein